MYVFIILYTFRNQAFDEWKLAKVGSDLFWWLITMIWTKARDVVTSTIFLLRVLLPIK